MSDIVPGLSRDVLDMVAAAGVVVGLLALLFALAAHWRLRRLRRRVRSATRRVALPASSTGVVVQEALRRVGLVRYDAFPDSAGMLSFSAALLDDGGNGIVLTSINGRHEARTYAKAVSEGEATQQLSPEERDAIARALAGGAAILVGTAPDGPPAEPEGNGQTSSPTPTVR